jgi:hypothetical protein
MRLGPTLDDASRHLVALELGRGEQPRPTCADHHHLGLILTTTAFNPTTHPTPAPRQDADSPAVVGGGISACVRFVVVCWLGASAFDGTGP